jgi:hypothetical protein
MLRLRAFCRAATPARQLRHLALRTTYYRLVYARATGLCASAKRNISSDRTRCFLKTLCFSGNYGVLRTQQVAQINAQRVLSCTSTAAWVSPSSMSSVSTSMQCSVTG